MRRIGDLWDKILDMDNIENAYDKARKGKMWQKKVARIDRDKDRYLEELQKSLLERTFTTSKYKIKMIYEPKARAIYILPFYPDRIVQHAVMNYVAPIWDNQMIFTSCSCRKGKGQHFGSSLCMLYIKRNEFCVQFDISKFYPSINHDILMGLIEGTIKDDGVLWLLEDIIRSVDGDTNVPIGNYTSQWFGNLYLTPLDRLIKQKYHVKDYIRYCDDFIIFGNDKSELREMADEIEYYLLSEFKLSLSKKSLFRSEQGLDFLGYRHFPDDKILVRKSTAKRIKKNISQIPYLLENGFITVEQAMGKMASANGWLSHANTHNLKLSIDFDNKFESILEMHRNEYQEIF